MSSNQSSWSEPVGASDALSARFKPPRLIREACSSDHHTIRAIDPGSLLPSATFPVGALRPDMVLVAKAWWFTGSQKSSTIGRHGPLVVYDAAPADHDQRRSAGLQAEGTERMLPAEGFRVSAPLDIVSLGCGAGLLRDGPPSQPFWAAPGRCLAWRIPTCVGMWITVTENLSTQKCTTRASHCLCVCGNPNTQRTKNPCG